MSQMPEWSDAQEDRVALEALADHMRILSGSDGHMDAWLEMQSYLLRGANAIEFLLASLLHHKEKQQG